MIQYKILQTKITRTVWQTVRRITKEILGVKGLKGGDLESKDPPLIRTEINGGPSILIHVFTLTCLLPCNV